MSADLHQLIAGFMLWVLLPLWFIAGVADYLLHRRTAIEHTSGWGESRLHVLQAVAIAIPMVAGVFLEINGAVIAIMLVCVAVHTLAAIWDVRYTASRRYISPLEQHVHSHIEYIPLVAVALVVLLSWNSFLGLLAGRADGLQLRHKPLPVSVVVVNLTAIFILQGVLLADEARRSWVAKKRNA
jgi:hypothetical protein